MLQDILPHVYHNEFSNKEPAPEDTALVFQNNCVLASEVNGVLTLPTVRQLQQAIAPSAQSHHLFCIDTAYYYLLLDCPIEPFGPWSYTAICIHRSWHLPVRRRRAYTAGWRPTGSAVTAAPEWKKAGWSGLWCVLSAIRRSIQRSVQPSLWR